MAACSGPTTLPLCNFATDLHPCSPRIRVQKNPLLSVSTKSVRDKVQLLPVSRLFELK